jgi:hypothetical protein
MKNDDYKMAIDFGMNDLRIFDTYDQILNLYDNYLMLYQDNSDESNILDICENNQDKAKFHFLIVDKEKQTDEAQAILKLFNTETYE